MSDNQRIEDLRRRVRQDPASIVFAQLAEELRRAGQLEDAVAECRSGLALRPSYVSARVTLGRALLELGRLDEAEAELRVALANAPNNVGAIRSLGEICQRRGLLADALSRFQEAQTLRYDPGLQRTIDELGRSVPDTVDRRPVSDTEAAAPESRPVSDTIDEPPVQTRPRMLRQLAALELWLDAIHVARTEHRP
jgi:tetratricopeptide (TPR) repeat protein